MNTPAIVNPTAVAAPGKQANAQMDATPDVPFNQVLSREVANRNDTANTERTPSASANPDSSAVSPPAQSAAKASGKNGETEKKAKDDSDKSSTDAASTDATAQSTPADLLALVANIGQMTGGDKATATTAVDGKAATDAKLGIDIGKADIASQIDAKTKAAGQLAAAKDGKDVRDGATADFAAEMKRGADPRQALDALGAKSQQAQPGLAEASAIEVTTKAVDALDTQAAAPAQQAVAALTAVQQAVQSGVASLPGHATDHLAPQVGTPAWDQALGQRITWMVAGSEQSASLTLNPPDLGPLQVVLNVSNSMANATFVAAQPEVRQALEAAMPKLRDMLGDAGIQLGQATVSSGMQQNQNGAQAETFKRSSSAGGDTRVDGVDTQIRIPRGRIISSGNGLVDTFV